MFKPGQEIWFIDFDDIDDVNDYSRADISCSLYVAECNDYIISSPKYSGFENDFDSLLNSIYCESLCYGDVSLFMINKKHVFNTKKDAENYLKKRK